MSLEVFIHVVTCDSPAALVLHALCTEHAIHACNTAAMVPETPHLRVETIVC